jgi:hypothetical protein
MAMTSSMSAVQSVPSQTRSPLGAFRPVTKLALATVPSPFRRTMRPLPSRPSGAPSICDVKIAPLAAS